jgi:hypothetical protein
MAHNQTAGLLSTWTKTLFDIRNNFVWQILWENKHKDESKCFQQWGSIPFSKHVA